MAKERRQLSWGWVWLGAIVILVLVFMAVRSLTRERLDVRVAQVKLGPLTSKESTNGRVEPEMNYQITSPLATTVKAVYVQPGDKVPAGKVLMQLDDLAARTQLATAEAAVKNAQAMLEAATHNGTQAEQQASAAEIARDRIDRDQAQHDLEALAKLNLTGAASASEVAAARQRLEAAEAALNAAKGSATNRYSPAEVARAQAALKDAEAGLAAAEDVENRTTVRAPIAGTVYDLEARATDFVEQGKVLLQMADLEHERVRAYFDEPNIGSLEVGQPVEITWDALPGKTWHGHIERVPVTVIQVETRRVGEALISLDDAGGQLLPNTNVTVYVTTAMQSNALIIPNAALRVESAGPFVFKVVGDELKRTPVTFGTRNVNEAAILSGLKAGDWVATGTLTGQPLQEGIPIKEVR
jgi:HlyD family secretion protein